MAVFVLSDVGLFLSSGGPKPDVDLARQRVGDLIPGLRNCEALGRALRARPDSYVHGWHALGTRETGWLLFLAGNEPFPTRRYHVAAWRIEHRRPRWADDPSEGVAALREKMENERYHSGPQTRMERFDPRWDLCAFLNVDAYRRNGHAGVPRIGLESMSEEMDHWNLAILATPVDLWQAWRPPSDGR